MSLINSSFFYKLNNNTIFYFTIFSLFPLLFFFLNLKSYELTFWWNHFYINNLNLNVSILILIFIIFFLLILLNNFFILNNLKSDFLFSLHFLFIISVFVYYCNNFFSFLFFLEIISLSVFFNFISSRIWKNNIVTNIDLKKINSFRKYLNLLFFQFWSSFFSTVILFFFFLILIFYFGTTEWSILNNFFNLKLSFLNFNSNYLFFFLFSLFIISFFLKLGITPIHLYKIEVYKGLPFISIFFYATLFFFIYFFYFIFLIYFYFWSFYFFTFFLITILSFFSFLFLIIQMFDINFSKSFFAYSTIANSLIFLFYSVISFS